MNEKVNLQHPIIGKHLIEIAQAIFDSDKTPYEIGSDTVRFRSCMLLFASLENAPCIFRQVKIKNHWV